MIQEYSIMSVPGLEKHTDNAFRWGVLKLAERRKLNPDYVAATMSLESARTFSPSIKNPGSSATGLIQFLSSTAKKLGTTTEALAKMTQLEQLEYVEKYYALVVPGGLLGRSLCDHYLAVYSPAYIGKSEATVIAKEGTTVYAKNKAFDRDGKGYYTKADVCQTIAGFQSSNRVLVTPEDTANAPPKASVVGPSSPERSVLEALYCWLRRVLGKGDK